MAGMSEENKSYSHEFAYSPEVRQRLIRDADRTEHEKLRAMFPILDPDERDALEKRLAAIDRELGTTHEFTQAEMDRWRRLLVEKEQLLMRKLLDDGK